MRLKRNALMPNVLLRRRISTVARRRALSGCVRGAGMRRACRRLPLLLRLLRMHLVVLLSLLLLC